MSQGGYHYFSLHLCMMENFLNKEISSKLAYIALLPEENFCETMLDKWDGKLIPTLKTKCLVFIFFWFNFSLYMLNIGSTKELYSQP